MLFILHSAPYPITYSQLLQCSTTTACYKKQLVSKIWLHPQQSGNVTLHVIKNFPYQRSAVTTLRPTTHIKYYNWAGWCNSHAL